MIIFHLNINKIHQKMNKVIKKAGNLNFQLSLIGQFDLFLYLASKSFLHEYLYSFSFFVSYTAFSEDIF